MKYLTAAPCNRTKKNCNGKLAETANQPYGRPEARHKGCSLTAVEKRHHEQSCNKSGNCADSPLVARSAQRGDPRGERSEWLRLRFIQELSWLTAEQGPGEVLREVPRPPRRIEEKEKETPFDVTKNAEQERSRPAGVPLRCQWLQKAGCGMLQFFRSGWWGGRTCAEA